MSSLSPQERLERYARLIVGVGANVAPGQLVVIHADVQATALVRAVAHAAYEAGASHVRVDYGDAYVHRSEVQLAPEEALGWSAPWQVDMIRTIDREHGSYIQIHGGPPVDLMKDLDPARVGKAYAVAVTEAWMQAINNETVNWTIAAYPTESAAEKMFGEPDVERLWQLVEKSVRLDEADPIEAWRRHDERLERVADWINSLELDSLHYTGPGTDFEVGLFPDGRFLSASGTTVWGRRYIPNLPTEEVFTSPDPRRAEGTIRSTRPLALGGAVVEDLVFHFRDGSITDVEASSGAEVVKAQLDVDANNRRLGEVALVDGSSRVGQLGVTFFNTLFDENAASHLAYGDGFALAVKNGSRVNEAKVHTDFMVGSPEVNVTGRTRSGEAVPVIKDNRFQVPGSD